MTVLVFVLAVAFGVLAGALAVIARVSPAKKRAYYTGGAAVSLIQALTFGVMATYPALQTAGYIIVIALVGIVLTGILVYRGRTAQV